MTSLSPPLLAWFDKHGRDLPWRAPNIGAWDVLVSEFMLQQTPVDRVKPHYVAWLHRWPTPTSLAQDSPASALVQWSNLGYPRRALRLHQAAVQVRDHFAGTVPAQVEDLLTLSGVGDYTARAVAVFAYGQRQPVVDTNTRRVIARCIHGHRHPGPAARRDLDEMASLLPQSPDEAAKFNAATMELGALICTSRHAHCGECPIAAQCRWRALGQPDTGDRRRRQGRYEGSDRQARGAVLNALVHAHDHAIVLDQVIAGWPDSAQRDRAIASLIADELVFEVAGTLQLPQKTPPVP